MLDTGAPVDGFGVGTRLGVSQDAPALEFAYKLTGYAGEPRLKSSLGKKLLPGPKQVWRFRDAAGCYRYDEIVRDGEVREGEPLLTRVVRAGQPLGPEPDVAASRERIRRALSEMPGYLLDLDEAAQPYPVRISDALDRLYRETLSTVEEG